MGAKTRLRESSFLLPDEVSLLAKVEIRVETWVDLPKSICYLTHITRGQILHLNDPPSIIISHCSLISSDSYFVAHFININRGF